MAIQVAQITGDTVELVFNPAEDDLHIGANLSVVGRHDDRGLIVQVIELNAIFSTSLLATPDQRLSVGLPSASPAIDNPRPRSPRRRKTSPPVRDLHGLHLAIAKIRKMTDPTWQPWDGWLPTSGVTVTKTADHEMLRQCIPESGNPLWLGKTLTDEPFYIERSALGRVNLIMGSEGSGTAHLVQVIVRELVEQGLPCIIFDARGVYALRSSDRVHSSLRAKAHPAIVHLVAGESLKLGLPHIDLDGLATMLRQFGLPTAMAMYFKSHVARRLARLNRQDDVDQSALFWGIDDLIRLAEDLEANGQAVAGGAILACLDAIKHTRVFATQPAEGTAFQDGYAQIRHGGALVIDLSRLPQCARTGVVSSLIGILRECSGSQMDTETDQLPCMFFDEAEFLGARQVITDVLRPLNHPDLMNFVVTTIVSRLTDHLQQEVDNLFLCRLASADVHHLAKRSRVDAATLRSIGPRLRTHHSLLVGRATGGYPIIFAVEPLDSVDMTRETAAFSHTPAAARMEPGGRPRPRFPARVPASVEADQSLPLFPAETPPLTATIEPRDDAPLGDISPPPTPTVAQVTAMWDRIVKRVSRRRRILETILAAARPLRVTDQRLVLGFPPQHRFQQELVESEEYRSLLEEELQKVFGVGLEVTTEVYPV